jgi:RNA polymerase sigma-70 factor (ECF subfamily)
MRSAVKFGYTSFWCNQNVNRNAYYEESKTLNPDADDRLSTLMKAAQQGDQRSYEILLTDVATLVRTFVRKRLSRTDWIEDIVQETLLSVHLDRHTYDFRRSFSPWMYAIAHHRMIDFIRKHRRNSQTETLNDVNLQEIATDSNSHDARGLLDLLHQALARLSNRQRTVVKMLKLEELSVKEISKQTGISESSVKVTAHRAYKDLRKFLGRHSR